MLEMTDLEEMKKAASAFQRFDKAYSTIQVYSNYMEDYPEGEFEDSYSIDHSELEEFNGSYENLLERIKQAIEVDGGDDPLTIFDIEYEIESVKTEQIDYEYLLALVDSYKQSLIDEPDKDHSEKEKEINVIIEGFSRDNPELSKFILEFIRLSQENPEEYKDIKTSHWMSERISEVQRNKLNEFATEYHLNKPALEFFASNYDPEKESKQVGMSELINTADYENYKVDNPNGIRKKLLFIHTLRQKVGEFVEDEILAYEIK